MNKHRLLVLMIILLGLLIRLYGLERLPTGLTWDEAAIGYNALSIATNLRDEHGEFLPLVFKSFGDFKPPIYIYLSAPVVAVMGLSETSTRVVSAVFGAMAIWLMYLCVVELSKKRVWAVVAAMFLAISPWHIFYSRGAWETNVMTTLLLIGIWGLVRSGLGKSGLWWGLTAMFLAMMTYQAGKLYVPLLLGLLVASSYLSIKGWTKKEMVIWAVFLLAAGWLFFVNVFTSAGNRLNRLSIFNYKPDVAFENSKYHPKDEVFHNIFELRGDLIASRYLTHFSTDFLFLDKKPTDRGHLPKLGQMYWIDALFLMVGLFGIWGLRERRLARFILGLLLISAIPGALTLAEFSSTRNLFMVVPLCMIASYGMVYIWTKSRVLTLPVVLGLAFCVLYFFDVYVYHSKTVLESDFNTGYKRVFEALERTKPARAVITDVYGQPYIYYLFYHKIDPVWYQKQGEYRERGIDVGMVGRVGNVEFRQFDMAEIRRSEDTFFAGGIGNYLGLNESDQERFVFADEVKLGGQEILFKMVKTK